jgi:hypothetical protein
MIIKIHTLSLNTSWHTSLSNSTKNHSILWIYLLTFFYMAVWKDIPWYEWLYQVSDIWEVKSLYNWRLMRQCTNSDWYMHLNLSKGWKFITHKVHRIVASAFIWIPNEKLIVNHKNGIKTDNNLQNLEVTTSQYNTLHYFHILWNNWSWKWKYWKDSYSKKVIAQYTKTGEFIRKYFWWLEAMRITWISNVAISNCCRWKSKSAWWFSWKYL